MSWPPAVCAWRWPPSQRSLADAALDAQIEAIHSTSRGTYGAPRVHAELKLGCGVRCGRKRVARLMRTAKLQGIHKRRGVRRCSAAPVHDDLVQRHFVADAPNRLWLTDITEHPTREGKVYLAAVLHVYARRIVGWSIADHLRTELVGCDPDGALVPASTSEPNGAALRPRVAVHVMGLRPSAS
jgi:transposase InsO family protein